MFSDSICICRLVLPQFLAVSLGFVIAAVLSIFPKRSNAILDTKNPFTLHHFLEYVLKKHLDICSLSLLAHTQYTSIHCTYVYSLSSVQFNSVEISNRRHDSQKKAKKSWSLHKKNAISHFVGPFYMENHHELHAIVTFHTIQLFRLRLNALLFII